MKIDWTDARVKQNKKQTNEQPPKTNKQTNEQPTNRTDNVEMNWVFPV